MIREWITLLQLYRRRSHSQEDYCQFQMYQGRLILQHLAAQGIAVRDIRVLDVGCGNGGYSRVLAEAGAQVTAIDIRRIAGAAVPGFVLANATRIPFPAGSFPLIFCASLIEHVPEPLQLLAEMKRVLTADGVIYLNFPPFYSPVGGHRFKPYHLLGERWALRLVKKKAASFATAYRNWGLYPLSIRRARALFAAAGLERQHESTRYSPVNLAALPWLGEFLTWSVQFLLRKSR